MCRKGIQQRQENNRSRNTREKVYLRRQYMWLHRVQSLLEKSTALKVRKLFRTLQKFK